ncbi:hypothetical protein [Amycolatopsis sp. NPDC050768]|uniref:hypothetical protein n=1 Tax=Amycolatopsis sp. NPDC050768 TaxID=3154839 RepID=UPI0033EE083E
MRFAHITRRDAEAQLDGFDYDDVSVVQEASAFAFDRSELVWDEAFDHAAQDVELELTLAEQAEAAAFLASESNQNRAARGRRRAGRTALRRNFPLASVQGSGETAAVRATLLGEVA